MYTHSMKRVQCRIKQVQRMDEWVKSIISILITFVITSILQSNLFDTLAKG